MRRLYTFTSVHHMIKAEKVLKEYNIACDIIPTPRAISTSCGLSIIVALADVRQTEELFQQAEISVAGVYPDTEKYNLYKDEGAVKG